MFPLIPTFRGGFLIGIAVIVFIVAMVNPSISSTLITAICFGLLISSIILSLFSLSGIEISRDICKNGVMGEEVYLPITVTNMSKRRRQAVIVSESISFSKYPLNEFAVYALLPLEKRIAERYVLASKRGKFNLNKLQLTSGDPAGLFQRVKTFELPSELTIFPGIEKISSIEFQTKDKIRSTVSGPPIGMSGQGQDIFGIREYRHGDPVRMIHWKASARQRRPVVKEFESHSASRISVLLDVDKRYVGNDRFDNNFEYLIMGAASLTHYLSGMYCQTSFITASNTTGAVFCETGSAYSIGGVVDALLAELQQSEMNLEKLLESSLDIVPNDSILYCLTMSASDNLYKYFDQLAAKGIEVRWLFAPPEAFPKIIPGIKQKEPDISLFGYGMHSPKPSVVKRGLELEEAIG